MIDELRRIRKSAPKVQAFLQDHEALFQAGSFEAGLKREFLDHITHFSAVSFRYTEGDFKPEGADETREQARERVWKWLEAIDRTAVAQQLTGFQLPTEAKDQVLVNYAQMFVVSAEAHQQLLIEGRLPVNFLLLLLG